MTIKEFITLNLTNEAAIAKLIKTKKSIGFEEKSKLAKDIVFNSTERNDGYLFVDEIKQFLVFIVKIIEAHTDLRFSPDSSEMMKEYDLLVEHDKLGLILQGFKNDYDMIMDFVKMESDLVKQQNTIEYQLSKITNNLNYSILSLTDTLNDKINEFDINNLQLPVEDLKSVTDFIKTYMK